MNTRGSITRCTLLMCRWDYDLQQSGQNELVDVDTRRVAVVEDERKTESVGACVEAGFV